MFIGREKELEFLTNQLKSTAKTAVLVYGKRRIGKSTLIEEAAKQYDGIVINHLCAQTTYQGNLDLLCDSICMTMGLPTMHFSQLRDIFYFLGTLGRKVLVILDEYQYLKQSGKAGEIDSLMQNVVDNLPSNVKLILCGSYITVMRELLNESNPLFGRFTGIIHLQEMDYYDASLFQPEVLIRQKLENYAVFGGSPYVQSILNPESSVRENVIRLLLPQTGILRTYIENVMLREIGKVYDIRILESIGNHRLRYSEINGSLHLKSSGLLDKQLKALIDMETISKVSPVNKPDDKKKQFYEITDNLMRFYFSYLFGKTAAITNLGEEAYYDSYIAPSLTEFISRRFEQIAIQYFRRLSRIGKLQGILNFGTLWYDDPVHKKNGEFDCVLLRQNGYDFYECKFYQSPMKLSECEAEEKQILSIPNITCHDIGFVCSSGFDFHDDRYKLISGEDLFHVK